MKTGYYFHHGGIDYFVATTAKRKTDKLCEQIISQLNFRNCNENISWLKLSMQPAVCELKHNSHGEYYDIHGDGFGGCGDYVTANKTVIVNL